MSASWRLAESSWELSLLALSLPALSLPALWLLALWLLALLQPALWLRAVSSPPALVRERRRLLPRRPL